MGYRAESIGKKKDGTKRTKWRVIWRITENGKKLARHVPESEYRSLGIHRGLTLDEANAALKQLNIQTARQAIEGRRTVIKKRLSDEAAIECANLPKVFVDKFANDHLRVKYLDNPAQLAKVLIHWTTAQRVIRNVDRPINEWADYPEHFYSYFVKNPTSWSYVKKLINVINRWGYFLGKLTDTTYHPIPPATQSYKSKIQDKYFEADRDKTSLPVTPAQLEAQKSKFKPEQFNWIWLTVWLGLRPGEVDGLHKAASYKIEVQDGTPVLWVYQSKLKNLARDKRWKLIPCFLPQQLECLEIIRGGQFERPLAKTMAGHFAPKTNCYAGRKGFTDLMKGLGQAFDDVSQWLGHQNLETTRKHYRDATRVNFKAIPTKK